MASGIFQVPTPTNEPVLSYAPGSPERRSLKAELKRMESEIIEIPAIIGGQEVRTGEVEDVVMPHAHGHVLAKVHLCGEAEVKAAIKASRDAFKAWSAMPYEERAAIILRAAELLAGPWRAKLNAATMLGQSKTCHQAEIDAACELIDFWRFNAHFGAQILGMQPQSSPGIWNRTDVRPLEGFVLAISPFNFTAIGGNLPTAPALMGNVSLWKPSLTSSLSNYYTMKLLEEAGMPPGVINFLPAHGPEVGIPALAQPDLAGIHFTGSTPTFNWLWQRVGQNINNYRSYPRVVGETGGKDFIFAHASADVDTLAVAILRGSFEFQGQKCSAASRIYVPDNLWGPVKDRVADMMSQLKVGDVRDFSNFMGAVIDRRAFKKISGYVDLAQSDSNVDVIAGGTYDDSTGYFIQPTFVRSRDPNHALMTEEIFGPVATAYVYPEARFEEALQLCDTASPYALTGAVFSNDRYALAKASDALRYTAGNFYINDKPTGAVVGQQPFGGGRASGTNDKAGSLSNLLRWISPRTMKETFNAPKDWGYPFLGEDSEAQS